MTRKKKKAITGKQMLSKAVKSLNSKKESDYQRTIRGTNSISQRDAYNQAMTKAQRNGGSNGIGVGP